MRIYLAATTAGFNGEYREQFIKNGKPKYMLETFFNGEKTCEKVLNDVGTENFLLDSGAFSYMSGAKCSKEMLWAYAERYADFIIKHDVKYYFELDVDTIFGIEFVEEVRNMLEKRTMRPCIPVWHKGRGVEYWKWMCDNYKYIAIGGLVFHVKKQEWHLIKKLVNYAYYKGVKVHGLGFTKTKELEDWHFWSVDSASWTKAGALGQQRYTFKDGVMEQHRVEGNGKKIALPKLVYSNSIEWCKYQKYMDSKRW